MSVERATDHRKIPASALRHCEPRIAEIEKQLAELDQQEARLPDSEQGGRSIASKQITLTKRRLTIQVEDLKSAIAPGHLRQPETRDQAAEVMSGQFGPGR